MTVERKLPSLPRYVVVPDEAVRGWKLGGTAVLEVTLNGVDVGRRTIKRWDRDRWFIDITQVDCRRLQVDTGARLAITLRVADPAPPAELAGLIRADRKAAAAWARLTPNQQRMLAEEVASAKEEGTRMRRAHKALLGRE